MAKISSFYLLLRKNRRMVPLAVGEQHHLTCGKGGRPAPCRKTRQDGVQSRPIQEHMERRDELFRSRVQRRRTEQVRQPPLSHLEQQPDHGPASAERDSPAGSTRERPDREQARDPARQSRRPLRTSRCQVVPWVHRHMVVDGEVPSMRARATIAARRADQSGRSACGSRSASICGRAGSEAISLP
jgi:hypothetical protein